MPAPNILFIMADDHAAHAMSCYGSAINTTPNLDRLAAGGMRLDNCFCTNSICTPSRASILTGTYNHVNGVTTLVTTMDNRILTFPKLLRQAGYQTAVIGKWHLGEKPENRPAGFDFWRVLPGQGDYHNPEMIDAGGARVWPGYATDIITDMSLDWLRQRDPARPFCLLCHHKAPHGPWNPDAKHAAMYADSLIPEPPTFDDDYATRSEAARSARMRIDRDLSERHLKQPVPGGLTPAQEKSWKYQRFIKDYLRCVASVDDNVGRLLDYLEENGLADNTIVIYTSDQGLFLGDHGWFDKRFMYEESLRMPFLIRYPREIKPGSSCPDMVLNVDFASTFLDFAGLPIPASFQGRSCRALLQGRTPADWRQSMYYRYWMQREIWHSTVAHYGVRTHRHKLICYYGQGCGQPGSLDLPSPPEWELFDLEKDPRELRNVAGDPAYAGIRAELTAELDRLQKQVGDSPISGELALKTQPPNLLLLTADDMNWDSAGAFGCPVPGTTPHLDRFAAEGLLFSRAHVTVAVCQPSRSCLMTGRYPHRTGGEGFFNLRVPGIPILPELLRAAGYRVGILGKVGHSTPYASFRWDMAIDEAELGHGRDPALYRRHVEAFVRQARAEGRPFFLMVNSHDPHRPFYGNDPAEWYADGGAPRAAAPSRVFAPGEIRVPGFLPDLPEVRREIAEYYSTVRRCDDTLGAVLAGLAEQGARDNTLTAFLSDNGMAFPFAKTNCYLNSTRTPWIMHWPGRILPGSTDPDHFVSGIDLMPTFLEAAGVPVPAGLDGVSFLPLLRGERQANRDAVFTQFHQTAGRGNYPMRCVHAGRFGYIFNPWADGKRVFRNESQIGRSFPAMAAAAESSADLAARVDLFLNRVPEELYDLAADPDALHNRIADPACAAVLASLRARLERWMVETGDPALEAFRHRDSREALETFLQETQATIGGRS